MILAPTLTLSSGSGALQRPTFSRDFAGEKTLNNGTGPAINFTRSSNATYFDADGVLQTAANNVPRFDHSGGNSLGLLIEEARTNSIRNSQGGGAATGSPGTMPTNWTHATPFHGLAREIVGTGTVNGLSYIDIRISGTTSTAGGLGIFFEGPTTASSGQTWTSSAYIALVAGSIPSSVRVGVEEAVGTTRVLATFVTTSPTATLTRFSATRTFTDATINSARAFIDYTYANGATVNFTLRIAAPQLEQGAFPTSYIPTTTAAATRSADFARVTPISSFYSQSQGTVFAEFSRYQVLGNNKMLMFFDTVNTARYLGIESDGTTNRFIAQNDAGSTVANIGFTNTTANTVYKVAGGYVIDNFNAAQNGTLGSQDNSGTPTSSLTHVGVGCLPSTNGQFFLNGHIRKIAYYPRRLSNELLQQLTT